MKKTCPYPYLPVGKGELAVSVIHRVDYMLSLGPMTSESSDLAIIGQVGSGHEPPAW
jgi:hypothetical protein